MDNFVNTEDVLGAEALEDAYLSDSLTEFADCRITSLTANALCNLGSLERCSLPNLTVLNHNALGACPNLKELHVPYCVRFWHNAILNCTALQKLDLCVGTVFIASSIRDLKSLTALVLRAGTLSTLENASDLSDSPIGTGTGYIYVPRHLVDEYEAATNWSAYAGQFRALQDYTVDGTIDGELDESKI